MGVARPASGIRPVGSRRGPPESIVIEPSGLFEAHGVGDSVPGFAAEVVNTSLGMQDRLIRIEGVNRIQHSREAVYRRAVPVYRHAGGVSVRRAVPVDSSGIRTHLKDVLVKTEDLHVLQSALRESRSEIFADELRLYLRREIHALPSAVIAHGFVHRRECPNIYTLSLPCLHVFRQIARIGIIVFRQQRTATMETVLALVVFLVLLHPRGCRPSIGEDAVVLVVLLLFERPHVFHQMIEIVVFVLDLRVLRLGKTLFVAVKRERDECRVVLLLGERVLAFHRKIRRSYLGADEGEVRTALAV